MNHELRTQRTPTDIGVLINDYLVVASCLKRRVPTIGQLLLSLVARREEIHDFQAQ